MLGDRVNSNYIIDYINENEFKKKNDFSCEFISFS